jgi:hypothetical protein
MNQDGWCTDSIARRISLQFCKGALILFMDGHLRPMMQFFDFSSKDMTRFPVWVKLPNLPLLCWLAICLSKIASVLDKPIQCDKLTSNLARLFYARVLVEIDLLKE